VADRPILGEGFLQLVDGIWLELKSIVVAFKHSSSDMVIKMVEVG